MKRFLKAFAVLAGISAMAAPSGLHAAGKYDQPRDARFGFASLFGTFDRASAQRGFQVYSEVCAACHGMRLLSYRNLLEIGLTEEQVRAIAANVQVVDGPNDEGRMFERPGRLSDRFRSPFPNEQAARAANNGAYPLDLSVMVKARKNGANYVYSLLTGYRDPPAGLEIGDGMHYNPYFPGRQFAMPNVLTDGQLEFADGTRATVEQMSRDVVTFMAWAAEPETEQRRRMGIRVLIFLAVSGVLAYAVKRRIWADLKTKPA